jgi:hypothetical protein
MTRGELLDLMRRQKHAVQSSASSSGPQASLVGIVVSDDFEIFFDTLDTTRKAHNLRADQRIAFVIGDTGDAAMRTVQCSGVADEPAGAELARLTELYFARFPDGRSRGSWPGITYFRVRLNWLRISDFTVDPPEILEFTDVSLRDLV